MRVYVIFRQAIWLLASFLGKFDIKKDSISKTQWFQSSNFDVVLECFTYYFKNFMK